MVSTNLGPDLIDSSYNGIENILRYASGGYHPIVLGDTLVGHVSSYRILHKLGHGEYATAWLAEDTSSRRLVAMKISTANEYARAGMAEARMLRIAQGHSSVVTLLDDFTVDGPNGTHSVLACEVVTPVVAFWSNSEPQSPAWHKALARGLVKGVAQLHEKSIVHGDLHIGNVGVAFADNLKLDSDVVMQRLKQPELIVLPQNTDGQTTSLPTYLVVPCANFADLYDSLAGAPLPIAKIFDFGAAHLAGRLPRAFQCASDACAPEIAFARVAQSTENPPVEPPSDVWALGTLIYYLYARSSLFSCSTEVELLVDMSRLAGGSPLAWTAALPKTADATPASADAKWANHRAKLRSACVNDEDADALAAMLRRILVLDPDARPTATQLLSDPWLYERTLT